ncbi:MAG TPA: ABC transporter ATP-binding protein [Candidatus Hydrogenedentes bacterium]|nr:ABC transporter ATP-binding protein [Candidatus Hydrogenedentota bacterium]
MIRLENVTKTYRTRRGPVNALDNVSIEVARGEFVVVRGPSGCGKSTLLLMIGGMLRPSSGAVLLDDADVYALSQRERNRLRATRVGFVFQMFHLVPYLTVIENVLLPNARAVGRDRALALLEQLGLADRALHRPGELSAGEKQRAALARALIHRPAIVLADEPTGNLDPENAAGVFGHLADYHKSGGTVVVVTHGGDGDVHADRVICLRAGCIEA